MNNGEGNEHLQSYRTEWNACEVKWSEGLPNQLRDVGDKSMQWKSRRCEARHRMPMDAKWVGAAWEVSRSQ